MCTVHKQSSPCYANADHAACGMRLFQWSSIRSLAETRECKTSITSASFRALASTNVIFVFFAHGTLVRLSAVKASCYLHAMSPQSDGVVRFHGGVLCAMAFSKSACCICHVCAVLGGWTIARMLSVSLLRGESEFVATLYPGRLGRRS
jgi:hypothetical protein